MPNQNTINTVLIHREESIRNLFTKVLASPLHPSLSLIGKYYNYEQYLERVKDPDHRHQIILLGVHAGSAYKNSIEEAERLKKHNKHANIIMITSSLTDLHAYSHFLRHRDIIWGAIDTVSELNIQGQLKRCLSQLIEEKKISRTLTVAMAGMGQLGSAISTDIIRRPWCKKYIWYSQNSEPVFEKLVYTSGRENSVHRARSLDELFEIGTPDILLITRGGSVQNYKGDLEKVGLDDVIWQTFPDSVNLVKPVFTAIEKKGYEGLVVPFTNPPGVFQWIAHHDYGVPKTHLTSFPIDSERTDAVVLEWIMKRSETAREKLLTSDLKIDVLGEHGVGVVPHWDRATIFERPFFDVLKEWKIDKVDFYNDEPTIIADIKSLGLEIRKRARQDAINSPDVAYNANNGLEMLAYFGQPRKHSIYRPVIQSELATLGYKGKLKDAFLMLSTRFDYGEKMRILRDGNLSVKKLGQTVKKQLCDYSLARQEEYVQKYLSSLRPAHRE